MIIEAFVRDFLDAKLSGISVYCELPANPSGSFVVIEKTGTSNANKLITSVLSIRSYGDTMAKAAELNETVKNAMDDLPTNDEIFSATLETDYNFTDLSTKRYRYQAVFDVVHF